MLAISSFERFNLLYHIARFTDPFCFNPKANMPPVVVLDNGGSTIKVNTAHDIEPRYEIGLVRVLIYVRTQDRLIDSYPTPLYADEAIDAIS